MTEAMIDPQGYRANVGIVLINQQGQVFWGRRIGMSAWQFPQGGINPDESAVQAMYRELREEVGVLLNRQTADANKGVKTPPRSAPARRPKKKPQLAGVAKKSAKAVAPTKPVLVQDPPTQKLPGRTVA